MPASSLFHSGQERVEKNQLKLDFSFVTTSGQRGHQDIMVTLTRLETGSREIFYCAQLSCSALCFSKAELERHAHTAHTKAGRVEDIEDDFNFDSDNEEEQEQKSQQTEKSTGIVKTEVAKNEAEKVKKEGENKAKTNSQEKDEPSEIKFETKSKRPYKKKGKKMCEDGPPVLQLYSCQTCNNSFNTQARLETHQFKVHSIGGEVCNICFKTCPNSVSLKAHNALNHSNEEKAPCHLCGKVFINKYRLSAHLKSGIHTEATIKCSSCPKLFPNKMTLLSHERVHDETKFLCSDCPISFKRIKRLEKHQYLVHEKPLPFKSYSCDECGKEFFFSSDLHNHRRFHKKDPASTCDVCHKTFSRPLTMRKHIDYVHNKVKNHSCGQCDYKAGQKEKLQKHIRFVHEKRMETCNICKGQFKHVYHHVKIHSNDFDNAWEVHKALKTETELTKPPIAHVLNGEILAVPKEQIKKLKSENSEIVSRV